MKKYISKIILVLSILFLAVHLCIIGGIITNNLFFHKEEQFLLVTTLGLFGLFLALYRIIDFLETHYEK